MGVAERVRSAIESSTAELVDLTLHLSHLPDRAGRELPVARAVAAWLSEAGIAAELQAIGPHSANVVARLPGVGGPDRPRLILCAHLDTEGAVPAGDRRARRGLRGVTRDGDLLVGKGLVNDRTQLAAQLVAVRAIRDSGGAPGELVLAAVAQETGRPPDPVRAPSGRLIGRGPHVGEGHGGRALLELGLSAEGTIVGEPTGFSIATAQAGVLQLRIDVPGFIAYTPFVRRQPDGSDNPFERAGRLLPRVEAWCREYADANRMPLESGTVAATAQVLEIRRGGPLYADADDWCHVFVDVRLLPDADPRPVQASLEAAIAGMGFEPRVEVVDHHAGHVARGADHLVAALRTAHRAVFGEEPPPPAEPQVSMWQDSNTFNEHGIPAVSYGIRPVPEPFTRERFRGARVADLVALGQVYALAALAFGASASADPRSESGPGAGTDGSVVDAPA